MTPIDLCRLVEDRDGHRAGSSKGGKQTNRASEYMKQTQTRRRHPGRPAERPDMRLQHGGHVSSLHQPLSTFHFSRLREARGRCLRPVYVSILCVFASTWFLFRDGSARIVIPQWFLGILAAYPSSTFWHHDHFPSSCFSSCRLVHLFCYRVVNSSISI